MSDLEDRKGFAVLFLFVWFLVANVTPYSGASLFLTALMFGIAGASIPFFRMALARGGERAWRLLCGLTLIAMMLIWLYPAPAALIIFWLWIAGLPLVVGGMLGRAAVARLSPPEWVQRRAVIALVVHAIVLFAFTSGSATVAIIWTAAAGTAATYGWLLGDVSLTPRHDARMGDAQEFEEAGFSRER